MADQFSISHHCSETIDTQAISMKAEIVFQIAFDDHFHMTSKDLKTVIFFDSCVVNDSVAFFEIGPQIIQMRFDIVEGGQLKTIFQWDWRSQSQWNK